MKKVTSGARNIDRRNMFLSSMDLDRILRSAVSVNIPTVMHCVQFYSWTATTSGALPSHHYLSFYIKEWTEIILYYPQGGQNHLINNKINNWTRYKYEKYANSMAYFSGVLNSSSAWATVKVYLSFLNLFNIFYQLSRLWDLKKKNFLGKSKAY